ncbi:Serine phosphatase RsbU, regulator of sigma subunit [Actinacidiphila rubida]|uniref:Serine phosphatase RsbU, regulator of sigma subunit n=1 Tax=Actinacidiphila rubida TaxID=310780 RepID=A0A1H8PWL6_9ACTN|nr:Serine phosphatase RsbU, regulator of sigma subunit [Actinacidiphila rubida]
MHEVGAAAATVFLRVPGTPELRAAVVAVTALGVGSVERVSVDDDVYPSAEAWRTGRVATAHSTEIMAGHPDLSVLAPLPYQAAAAPLFSATHRFGTITAFWLSAHGGADRAQLERLAEIAADLTAGLEELADRGQAPEPPRVPVVVAVDDQAADGGRMTSATAPLIYHLHKLAILLPGVTRTRDAVDLAMERVMSGFGASAAIVSLIDADRLYLAGASGCAREFLRTANGVPLGRSTPETDAVARQRQTLYATADPRVRGRLPDEASDDDCFWVVLPLLVGDRPVGALSMAFDQRHKEIVAEQATLTALATVLAQAVERTQMHEARHELAEGLQQALLPRMLPQPAGVVSTSRYASATSGIELGGDWYDLIGLPAGGVAMVIGDVEGHNTAAAVVMGQLRSAVRAYAAEGHDPAAVLTRANQLLVGLDTDLFATCCCVWLDPDTGRTQIASAGHPPPLIFTNAAAVPLSGLDVGIPLGIEAGARYEAAELELEPGALLACFTDGLVDFAGDLRPEAVKAAFAGERDLESLADQLIGGFEDLHVQHADDAALLLARYEGPSAEARRNVRQLKIHRRDLLGAQRTRALLRQWLDGWGLADMADEEELLVSEVVTNGLVHGDSDVYVYVRRYPERVRVEVRDSDPHPAQAVTIPREEDQAEGGRGLVIVSALASAWGNSPGGRGKTVWFELPIADPERGRHLST